MLVVVGVAAAQQQPSALRHFKRRIDSYIKLREKASSGVSAQKPSSSPDAVVAAQRELAQRIRDARRGANRGKIFASPVSGYLRRQLAQALNGPEGAAIRASLRSAEPTKPVRLHVNDSWPESVPLQSMPAGLLEALPKLPKELEYRLLGSTLVLRDGPANLVIDYLPDAVTSK